MMLMVSRNGEPLVLRGGPKVDVESLFGAMRNEAHKRAGVTLVSGLQGVVVLYPVLEPHDHGRVSGLRKGWENGT